MTISRSFDINSIKKERPGVMLPSNPTYLPEIVGKVGKWIGEYVSMPEQKLFLAASACVMQPIVDIYTAQEDKRVDVAIKSASKAIAGGITGVTIRALFEKYFNNKISYNEKGIKKYNDLERYLFPQRAIDLHKVCPTMVEQQLKQYCSTLGVIVSLLVMVLITNEHLDVPITSDFQDLFTGIAKENKSFLTSLNDVSKARFEKIKKWLHKQHEWLNQCEEKAHRIIRIVNETPENRSVEYII